MIIRLNENKFNRIFLFEGNGSKAAKRTREVIAKYLNKTPDDPEVIELEHKFKANAFGEGAKKDWFVPIEPVACEWWLKDGMNDDKVKDAVGYLVTKAGLVGNKRVAFMQYLRTLTNMKEVKHFVLKCKKEDRKIARENVIEKPKLNPNYEKVLGPLSFEEAHKYYPKTGGNGASCPICYTQYESTWSSPSYSDRGTNSFFLLLRKDWEKWDNTRAVHDGSEANNELGDPYDHLNAYDDYGLSMILVWVTPDGELYKSNTRWNHAGNFITPNVDKAFTVEGLEKLMNAKFKDIFNVENILDKLDVAEERVQNGENPEDVFDEVKDSYIGKFSLVKYCGKYNLLNKEDRTLMLDEWSSNEFKPINKYGDFEAIIDKKKEIINIDTFEEITPDEYLNVINERLASGANPFEQFSYVKELINSMSLVGILGKHYNFLKESSRKLIFDKWFDDFRLLNNPNLAIIIPSSHNSSYCNIFDVLREKFLFEDFKNRKCESINKHGDLAVSEQGKTIFIDVGTGRCFNDEKQFILTMLEGINNGEFHYINEVGEYEFNVKNALETLFNSAKIIRNICIAKSAIYSNRWYILDLRGQEKIKLLNLTVESARFINEYGDVEFTGYKDDTPGVGLRWHIINADTLDILDRDAYPELMLHRIINGGIRADELYCTLEKLTDNVTMFKVPYGNNTTTYLLSSEDYTVIAKNTPNPVVMNKIGDIYYGSSEIILGDTLETIRFRFLIPCYEDRINNGVPITALFDDIKEISENLMLVSLLKYEYKDGLYNVYDKNSRKFLLGTFSTNFTTSINGFKDCLVGLREDDEEAAFYLTRESQNLLNAEEYEKLLRQRLNSGVDERELFYKSIPLGNGAFLVGFQILGPDYYKTMAWNILLPNKDFAWDSFNHNIEVKALTLGNAGMRAVEIETYERGYANLYNRVKKSLVIPTYDIEQWPEAYFSLTVKNNPVFVLKNTDDKFNFCFNNGNLLFNIPIEEWNIRGYSFISGSYGENKSLLLTGVNLKHNVLLGDEKRLLHETEDIKDWFDYIDTDFRYIRRVMEDGKERIKPIDMYFVVKSSKWNVYIDNKLLWNYPLDYWFDKIESGGPESDGIRVYINGLTNRLFANGTLLWKHNPDEWFDEINYTNYSDYWVCGKGEKYCILKRDGTILGGNNAWFNSITYNRDEKVFEVKNDNYECILDLNGNITEHDDIIDDDDINSKINQQLANGVNPEEIFKCVYKKDENGNTMVRANIGDAIDVCNMITPKNQLLTKRWFRQIFGPDDNGNYKVSLRDISRYPKYTIMKPDGTFLWNHPKGRWFRGIEETRGLNGYYKVDVNFREINVLDQNGNFVLDKNVRSISAFRNGYAELKNTDGTTEFLDTNFRIQEPTREIINLFVRRI